MAIAPAINIPINCGLATTPQFSRQFSKKLVSQRSADLEFSVELKELQSGSSENVAIGDINYNRVTYPTSGTSIRVSVVPLEEEFPIVDSILSSNNSVLDPSEVDSSLFEYQSNGSASITATLNTNEKITKAFTTSVVSGGVKDNFTSFQSGSVGKHIFDQIREYADNSTTPPNHYPIYSTFDFTNNVFVRNVGHWSYPLDFSGLMVNKSGSGGVTMVTAITPYHAVGVEHYHPEVGDTIVFCDSNNQTISRQVVSGGQPIQNEDYWIVRFDSPLPPSVKKYKLLPSNYTNYFPKNKLMQFGAQPLDEYRFGYVPIIVCSHYRWDADWPIQRPNRYAYVYETFAPLFNSILYYPAESFPNNFPNYNGNGSNVRGGDSGGPSFFVVNNDLILVAVHRTGNWGPFVSNFIQQTQDFINQLGPSGQTVQTVDLSGFTDFSP